MQGTKSAHALRIVHAMPPPAAGMLAGLVAGAAYLAAQMSFHVLIAGRSVWEPLQRIAAMLLGPDAAPPPADISVTIGGFGLLIHLSLAMVYGRCVERLTVDAGPTLAALRGAAFGVFLYATNFLIIAPFVFPWFSDSPVGVTLADHIIFGSLAGCASAMLRKPAADTQARR